MPRAPLPNAGVPVSGGTPRKSSRVSTIGPIASDGSVRSLIWAAALISVRNRSNDRRRKVAVDDSTYDFGFDAQKGEYKDMVAAGIIDPTKVVRIALQNAASIAGLIITTEAMVFEHKEDVAA